MHLVEGKHLTRVGVFPVTVVQQLMQCDTLALTSIETGLETLKKDKLMNEYDFPAYIIPQLYNLPSTKLS